MNIIEAIEQMKQGSHVRRPEWEHPNDRLRLSAKDDVFIQEIFGEYPLRTSFWVPSQYDILANNWEVWAGNE